MEKGQEESQMKTFDHLPPIPGKRCDCGKPAVRRDSSRQYVCARCSNLECRDGIERVRERACGVDYTRRKLEQKMKKRMVRAGDRGSV